MRHTLHARAARTSQIEERINQILEEKRELFESVFATATFNQQASATKQTLSRDEIFSLFNLHPPAHGQDHRAAA